MPRLIVTVEQFLRCEGLFARLDLDEIGSRDQIRAQLRMILIGGVIYGAVMGSFSGLHDETMWWARILASAVKVPFLFLVTFLLCLPSFYVMNALVGLHGDFLRVINALLGFQTLTAIVLAALAPITWLMNQSSPLESYSFIVLWNGIVFGVATFCGFGMMRRLYRPLIARNRRHRWMQIWWVLLYTFVGIQMAWVLRPFVGNPKMPFQLIREDTWGNAYLKVLGLIERVVGGWLENWG